MAVRGSTEESRERKIALFWTLVLAFENSRPITQDEIVKTLMVDEYPVTTRVPRRKLAYEGNDNAFRQKFERDKAAIRDLGYEISTTKTLFDVDGYSIDPASVFVPALDFLPHEFAIVNWSTQLLGIGSSGVGRLFADGPTPDGGVEFSPILQPLTRAASEKRIVRFKYRKDNDKIRERELAPLEFLFWHGQSYVIGAEKSSGQIRGFRVSRIVSTPTVLSENYAATDDERTAATRWIPSSSHHGDHVLARFVTSAPFARLIQSQYTNVTIDHVGATDAVQVAIDFDSMIDARRAIVTLGDRVRELRPKALRDSVRHWLLGVNERTTKLKDVPEFVATGSRQDTLGQTLQLIAAVYQSADPLRASELASRCHLDVELVRSIMSRLMALQYLRDPTKYLVHIEPADELDDVEELDDPSYGRSSSYDEKLGSNLAALTWRDAYELLVALKEAAELYPSDVLASVIAKIERQVQARVRVVEAGHEFLATLRDAIDQREQIKITYWSAGSDQVSERWVEPRALALRNGTWYFRAFCATRDSWLTFRLDRVLYVHASEKSTAPRLVDTADNWADHSNDEGYEVTIVLPADQRWIFEPIPGSQWAEFQGHHEIVRLRVRDDRFLEQLMVESGPGAWILDGPDLKAGHKLAQRMMDQL